VIVPERVARWLRALADQIELGVYASASMNDEIVMVREKRPDSSVMRHRTGERVITLRLEEAGHYFTPQNTQKHKEVRDVKAHTGQPTSNRVAPK